jgi:hypothetical protein
MSKAKTKRKKVRGKAQSQTSPETGRRKFLALGLGGLGTLAAASLAGYRAGWFGSDTVPSSPASSTPDLTQYRPLPPVSLSADYQNALRAAGEIVRHYARELNNPSALIHAVRAFGKSFTLNDGTKAIDYLCSKYALEKEVNGKRYVYFPREVEVHDNSFLKTMLEAGVNIDEPITVGGNRYTLSDLGESSKALFRCDPANFQRFDSTLLHEHLPWGLIAFSILVPPSQPAWVNAYGESINLPEVIDRGLGAFENSCAGVRDAIARGEAESFQFRKEMTTYSCYGMHMVYGFFSCLNHGYRNNNLQERLREALDTVIHRLEGDAKAIDRETEAAHRRGQDWIKRMGIGPDGKLMTRGSPPPKLIEVMSQRHLIRMLGHAIEAINYAQLHRLFALTPEQKKRLQAGEQLLYKNIVQMRATDLGPFAFWHDKFVSDIVIAVAHAVRAMKLLTSENPDTIAVNRASGDGL